MAGQARCLQLPARQRLRAAGLELHRQDAGSTACLPSRASPMGSSRPGDGTVVEPDTLSTDPEARSRGAIQPCKLPCRGARRAALAKSGRAGPRSRRGSSMASRCRAPLHQAGLQEPLHPRIPDGRSPRARHQGLPGLWASVSMAQEMEGRLGGGALLLGALPPPPFQCCRSPWGGVSHGDGWGLQQAGFSWRGGVGKRVLTRKAAATRAVEVHRQACIPPSKNIAPDSRVPTSRPAALAM